MTKPTEQLIDEKIKEFRALVKHDEDFNCVAHGEGQECCLDVGTDTELKMEDWLSKSLAEATKKERERCIAAVKSHSDNPII